MRTRKQQSSGSVIQFATKLNDKGKQIYNGTQHKPQIDIITVLVKHICSLWMKTHNIVQILNSKLVFECFYQKPYYLQTHQISQYLKPQIRFEPITLVKISLLILILWTSDPKYCVMIFSN